MRALGEPVGDCVDCYQCVAVCPTGIDIRDGAQLDCIQCGLCIDACDTVMKKIGRETRLIGYDNDINIHRRAGRQAADLPHRPAAHHRLCAMIAAVGAIMLYALLTRSLLDVNVLHDRNPVAVKLSDGSIRNAYTVRLLNKRGFDRVIAIDVDGPVNATVHVVGADSVTPDRPMIVLGRDQTTELRLLVTAPAESNPEKSIPVQFRVTDIGLGEVASATDNFVVAMRSERSIHMSRASDTPKPLTGRTVLFHAGRVLRRRDRGQPGHDAARDPDLAGHRGRQRL